MSRIRPPLSSDDAEPPAGRPGADGAGLVQRLLSGRGPKLLNDLVVLAGGQLATKLIAVAAFAVLARTLDPAAYGAVEYMVGLTGLFALAVECGLGTIGVRRIARSRDELPLLAALIPLTRLLVALVCIPLLVACAKGLGPPLVSNALVLLFAASLLFAPWNQDWLLQSVEMMSRVALAHMLRVLVFAAGVLLLVHGPTDVAAVGMAELIAAGFACAWYVGLQNARVTPFRLFVSAREMLSLVREGAAVGASTLVWAAAQYMPLFLIGSLVGGAHVGWYGAAQRIVTSIAMFGFVYHFNLYPALARAATVRGAAFGDLLRLSFRVTAWASIGAGLALMLAAEPILSTIFGARFAAAASAFALLVWCIPVMFLSGHARGALVIIGAQSQVLYAQIAGLVAVVAAGVPLVKLSGEMGAAAAAVAGCIVVWLYSHLAALRRAAPLPSIALIARPLALALGCAAAAQWLDAGPLARTLVGIALYALTAPWIDRSLIPDLVTLAHAKATVTPSESA